MKIENSRYVVTFDTKGGEMTSFLDKETGLQYLWQGDPAYWSGKNPTLFPMIGNTYTKDYEIDGKKYAMKNHGLIRYATLNVKEQSDTKFVMELNSNEETLAQYPFEFHYEIQYELEEDGRLVVSYVIENTSDTKQMPFTFGLHPGFNCPLCEGEKFEDYTLSFTNEEHMQQLLFDVAAQKPYELIDVVKKDFNLSYEEIEKYATIIYKGTTSPYLTLKGPQGHGVRMSIGGYPYCAIWTAKTGAPFVCLEPWYGHGDFSAVAEDFYHREGTFVLEPNETFLTGYTIEVF